MTSFKASYEGIGEMLCSDGMVAEMRRRAEKVKVAAEALAPYDPTSIDGSHYRDSFKVTAGVERTLATLRAVGRVSNADEAAVFIEYGTSKTPDYHVLGKAIDAARD